MSTIQQAAELQSRAEAHLYIAIMKSDGNVSALERARAGYYSRKSHGRMHITRADRIVGDRISADLSSILADQACSQWTPDMHVDQGLELLEQARRTGGWSTELSAARLRKGLQQVAYLNGYTISESRFVKKVIARLEELQ